MTMLGTRRVDIDFSSNGMHMVQSDIDLDHQECKQCFARWESDSQEVIRNDYTTTINLNVIDLTRSIIGIMDLTPNWEIFH